VRRPRSSTGGWGRRFRLVVSHHIIDGAARAWADPYWRARFERQEIQRAVWLLRNRATVVTPVGSVQGVADDEEDDLVLATAVAGRVPYLVTGDRGLIALGSYEGIVIIDPAAFLQRLDEARPLRQ
jgi:predicted nucleic acid-binding protein